MSDPKLPTNEATPEEEPEREQGVLRPANDTYAAITAFAFNDEVTFEEMQSALLSLADRHQELRNSHAVEVSESADLAQRLAEAERQRDYLKQNAEGARLMLESERKELHAALATVEQLRAEHDRFSTEIDAVCRQLAKSDNTDAFEGSAPAECVSILVSQRDDARTELAQLREELARVRSVVEDVIDACDHDVPNFPRKRIKEACLAALKQPAGGQP